MLKPKFLSIKLLQADVPNKKIDINTESLSWLRFKNGQKGEFIILSFREINSEKHVGVHSCSILQELPKLHISLPLQLELHIINVNSRMHHRNVLTK